jgi:hypothetical protein
MLHTRVVNILEQLSLIENNEPVQDVKLVHFNRIAKSLFILLPEAIIMANSTHVPRILNVIHLYKLVELSDSKQFVL